MSQATARRDSAELSADAPTRPAAKPRSREHVAYIEYFRAVAIFIIVLGHSYALSWTTYVSQDPQLRVTWLNVVPALVTGGTAYFVFISGFLYRQVFFGRTPYGEFMRKKALYVGLPYLVLSTPLIIAEIASGTFVVTMTKDGVNSGQNEFIDYIALLSTGRVVTAYWYIPFIFVVFLASPLFDRFIRMDAARRLAVMAAAVAVAFWLVRPSYNLNPVHSFLYFAQFYLFGIVFCEYRAAIMPILSRRAVILGLLASLLLVAAFQAMVLQVPGNLERLPQDGLRWVGFDTEILQKYLGILLACGALNRWGALLAKPFAYVADHSFGIFFTHGIVIAVMVRLPQPFLPHVGEPLTDLAIYGTLVFAISLAVVVAVRQLTGRYSRYVIGC